MRLTADVDLLEVIREAGRLMVAQPEKFTGHVRANITDGSAINLNVDVLVKLNGSHAVK